MLNEYPVSLRVSLVGIPEIRQLSQSVSLVGLIENYTEKLLYLELRKETSSRYRLNVGLPDMSTHILFRVFFLNSSGVSNSVSALSRISIVLSMVGIAILTSQFQAGDDVCWLYSARSCVTQLIGNTEKFSNSTRTS